MRHTHTKTHMNKIKGFYIERALKEKGNRMFIECLLHPSHKQVHPFLILVLGANPPTEQVLSSPMLLMKNPKPREVKSVTPGHYINSWYS